MRGLDAPQRLTSSARRAPVPPPVLGQHSAEILAEAGYDAEAIAKLHEQGVTAPRRTPKRR